MKAEFEKLRRPGATVIREPYQLVDEGQFWIATLADPDNNYFQLMTPLELPQEAEESRRESTVSR